MPIFRSYIEYPAEHEWMVLILRLLHREYSNVVEDYICVSRIYPRQRALCKLCKMPWRF